MKSQPLSILSGATDPGTAPEIATENQTGFSRYHTRYQAFLNRQTSNFDSEPHRTTNPIRLLRGLFSFAVFVAMFLAILTLIGFGLSSLGVIAQISPSSVATSNKQGDLPANHPPNVAPKKRKSGK